MIVLLQLKVLIVVLYFRPISYFASQFVVLSGIYGGLCDNPTRNMAELAISDDCKFGKPN